VLNASAPHAAHACASHLLTLVDSLSSVVKDMAAASIRCIHMGGQSLKSMACVQVAANTLQHLAASVHEGVVAHRHCPTSMLVCDTSVALLVSNAVEAQRWAHVASMHCNATGQPAGWWGQFFARVGTWAGETAAHLKNATQGLQSAVASSNTTQVLSAVGKVVQVVEGRLRSLVAVVGQRATAGASASSFVQQLKIYFLMLPSLVSSMVTAAASFFMAPQ